jgi:hypothetical protein
MALNQLFEQVIGAIMQHSNQQQQTGFDPTNLLSHVEGLFSQHATNTGQAFLPASRDPYGDPADQGGRFGNIKPASQDPYGDPADR